MDSNKEKKGGHTNAVLSQRLGKGWEKEKESSKQLKKSAVKAEDQNWGEWGESARRTRMGE